MRQIKKGATDQSVVIRIIDSTDGTPETGVVWNTSGIDLWYRREAATKTSITEATLSALNDAHSDGGVLHIGDGYYRLDLPDAAVATGANGVMVGGTVTGMIVIGTYVHLVDYDPQDTVRAGLTALPNAAADAAGGLVISDAGGLDIDDLKADINTIDDFLDTEIAAIKAKTDNLPADPADASDIAAAFDKFAFNKNTAYSSYMFEMVDATDGYTPETGLTPTCTRSIDGAAFAACANSPSEVASGWYKIDLAASDLNGDEIVLRFTGTGSRTWEHKIRTIAT